jgi:arylsulfatase A-like enzyme
MYAMRYLSVLLAPLALGTLLGGGAQAEEGKARPNIVFILADDLGINDLGCYGRKDHETPRLDRLAKQGIRFTSAYAEPVCSPTRAALLTGKAPARLHLTTFLPGRPASTSPRSSPAGPTRRRRSCFTLKSNFSSP